MCDELEVTTICPREQVPQSQHVRHGRVDKHGSAPGDQEHREDQMEDQEDQVDQEGQVEGTGVLVVASHSNISPSNTADAILTLEVPAVKYAVNEP